MKGKKLRFGFDDLGLTIAGIEDIIGYNAGEEREFILSMISDAFRECRSIADTTAEYRIFENAGFSDKNKTVKVGDTCFEIGKIIFSQIKRSEGLALFMCTAGEKIGKMSRRFMQDKELLTGYIYDVIGSEVVEAAADLMQQDIEEAAKSEGLKITNRYSPGYCGWNVNEQHKFFSLFPDNFCGIKLLPSALMDPEKSVSGIIGTGAGVKKNPYTCRLCDMKDCIYRKNKLKKATL